MAKNLVWVTFEKEAIHKYPAALTDPKLADVSFLGYPHRHILKFKVWMQVFHDDRDLEFIQEKRYMQSLYADKILELDYKSMEMIANDLSVILKQRYAGQNRWIAIEVSEDGENGCYIEYPADDQTE